MAEKKVEQLVENIVKRIMKEKKVEQDFESQRLNAMAFLIEDINAVNEVQGLYIDKKKKKIAKIIDEAKKAIAQLEKITQ